MEPRKFHRLLRRLDRTFIATVSPLALAASVTGKPAMLTAEQYSALGCTRSDVLLIGSTQHTLSMFADGRFALWRLRRNYRQNKPPTGRPRGRPRKHPRPDTSDASAGSAC